MASDTKKKKKSRPSPPAETQSGKKAKLGIRIGAALLLVAVVAGVVFPLYNPGSPIKSRKKVLSVNSHDISADEFEYFLSNEISEFVYYNGGSYFADQKNMSDLLDYVSQEITFYYVFLDWAKENGYALTQEQKDEIRADMESQRAEFESEEAYQEYLDGIYATEKVLYETECMFRSLNNYYDHLMDPENSPYAESAKVLADDPERFNIYGAKHILFLFGEDGRTDEETHALAEDVLKQIRDGGSFDELMKQYSEDPGLTTNPDGYTFAYGEMVDEFYNGTAALKIGETSELIESDYGYHIIRRIEPDRDQVIEKIIGTLYGAEIDSRVAAAEVSKSRGFDDIKYSDFKIAVDYPADVPDSGDQASEEDQENSGN